jgi:hypothetical protein
MKPCVAAKNDYSQGAQEGKSHRRRGVPRALIVNDDAAAWIGQGMGEHTTAAPKF